MYLLYQMLFDFIGNMRLLSLDLIRFQLAMISIHSFIQLHGPSPWFHFERPSFLWSESTSAIFILNLNIIRNTNNIDLKKEVTLNDELSHSVKLDPGYQ